MLRYLIKTLLQMNLFSDTLRDHGNSSELFNLNLSSTFNSSLLDWANLTSLNEPKRKLKKKKRRLKEEVNLWEESRRPAGPLDRSPEAAEACSKESPAENTKTSIDSTAAVIVWDSQVKDGYKRRQAPAADQEGAGDAAPPRATPAGWDGKKSSSVVEELLKNSADTAYGTQVLSWEGGASAISRDAIEDARFAKHDTVLDEWDEEFDSGKVKKVKKYKREKWRSGNVFQKIQDRKSMWSVTPGGKKSGFGFRR